jgi:hypothetical protein
MFRASRAVSCTVSYSTDPIVTDALHVFGRLAEDVGPIGVIALVVDADGETIDLCICDDDDAVEERSRLLLELYAGDATAVVFATIRTGPTAPTAAEVSRYERLREHADAVGLPLLDWCFLGDDAR